MKLTACKEFSFFVLFLHNSNKNPPAHRIVCGDESSVITIFDLKKKKLLTNIKLSDEISSLISIDSFLLPGPQPPFLFFPQRHA